MESSPAEQPRSGREGRGQGRSGRGWVRAAVGALIGIATYVAILIAVFRQEPHPDDPGDLRPVTFILAAAYVTPVMLLASGVLAVWRRVRPIGLGLLLGMVTGLVGTMGGCYALL